MSGKGRLVGVPEECKHCMAMSGLGFRKVLVGNGWAVSLLLCMIELRKLFSHIVGPPILALKVLLH